jgi:hypothetical protein
MIAVWEKDVRHCRRGQSLWEEEKGLRTVWVIEIAGVAGYCNPKDG